MSLRHHLPQQWPVISAMARLGVESLRHRVRPPEPNRVAGGHADGLYHSSFRSTDIGLHFHGLQHQNSFTFSHVLTRSYENLNDRTGQGCNNRLPGPGQR